MFSMWIRVQERSESQNGPNLAPKGSHNEIPDEPKSTPKRQQFFDRFLERIVTDQGGSGGVTPNEAGGGGANTVPETLARLYVY